MSDLRGSGAERQRDSRGAEGCSSLPALRSSFRRRGVVLILVLGAVAILTILAVEVSHRAGLSASAAARVQRDGVFERAFQSGIAVAQALISEGRSKRGFDYLGDPWNQTVEIEPEPGVKVRLSVADEAGKLNIATALNSEADAVMARQGLRRLFTYLRMEDTVRSDCWDEVEKGVLERLGLGEKKGGEEKKQIAPLLTLDGLREAGLSRESVFGPLDREKEPDSIALADLLTVQGKGMVNLNTAPKAVFHALDPEFDVDQVEKIAAWRGDGRDDPRPFQKVNDLAQVARIVVLDTTQEPPVEVRNVLRKVQGRVAVNSGYFSARIVVEHGGKVREGWAFLGVGQPDNASPNRPAGSGQVVSVTGFEEIEP